MVTLSRTSLSPSSSLSLSLSLCLALSLNSFIPVKHSLRDRAGKLLANAIKTKNSQAFYQVLSAFTTPNVDLNYTDEEDGQPLLTLAVLTNQNELAIHLLDLGCNPLACNTAQRSSLYVIIEVSAIDVLKKVMWVAPQLDLNQPVTLAPEAYCPIHVAAR